MLAAVPREMASRKCPPRADDDDIGKAERKVQSKIESVAHEHNYTRYYYYLVFTLAPAGSSEIYVQKGKARGKRSFAKPSRKSEGSEVSGNTRSRTTCTWLEPKT
mmetsp:Transcript_30763/g.65132  ORF Transcript_30763/g.65132 Transcript_30763/m.65132 type:complete len:105 (+) Transcript_30763:1290-1604(+)